MAPTMVSAVAPAAVVVEAEIMVMLVLQMEEFMELHLVVCLI